jgi:microcystin-dependent protein
MIVALIALAVALSGTAIAAGVGPNSVGTRQLKSKAVTTGKLANSSVNSLKVADKSLSGADIDLNALGTVPTASHADSASNSDAVNNHSASCPANTQLIRGVCFDSSPNTAVNSVQLASDACTVKGGYLPSPMELYSTRSVINLGNGSGSNHQYTDSYYGNDAGGAYFTVVIDGTGAITQQAANSPSQYVCAYPLVR